MPCLRCSSWTFDKNSVLNKNINVDSAGYFCGEMSPICCVLDVGKICGLGCYGQANTCFINVYPPKSDESDHIFQVWMMPPPCCCNAGCAFGTKQDQQAVERLSRFRTKSFSRLSSMSFNEEDGKPKPKIDISQEIGRKHLKSFNLGIRSQSLSRLTSVNESNTEPTKLTKLQAAVLKKDRELKKEIGNSQLWKFRGGCCCCLYPTGPGSWKGEAHYRKDPQPDASGCLGSLGFSCISAHHS